VISNSLCLIFTQILASYLEGLGDLTPEQEETLSEIKGREYAELDSRARAGKELSEEDKAKYKGYNDGHGAAIAKEKAEAQRRAAEEARRKPEPQPGTLPAVASGKAPEGVDSMGAIGDILRKEKIEKDLASMFTPEQLAPLAEQSKQEYWDKYIDPRKIAAARMEEWAAEDPRFAALCADDMISHHLVDNSINEAKGTLIGVGVVTFGAALWTAPVATAVETGVAIAMDKLAETAALSAGCSTDTASTIGTVTGFVTPFATMGKVGALADATLTPALKAAGTMVKGAAVEAVESSIAGIKAAGRELGQWRPDPHAMGSGFVPLTRKAPVPAGATPLEIATADAAASASTVVEAGVSGAPVKLIDGMKVKVNNALDMAKDFLGEGYIYKGNGRYVSKDGIRQVRMGDSDILGHHAGGRHMNFEHLGIDSKTQRIKIEEKYHIFIEE
jgi:hypothetical protein